MKITTKQKIRGWGTALDYIEKTPSKYIGKSFYEAWHEDIEAFKKLTDEEKWEMGYWIENQTEKRSGRIGLIVGFILGILFIFFILNIINLQT